jgi:glycosyltransferase involved in cell wall biosynthesis
MLIFELSDGCPATSNGRCGLFQFDQAKALSLTNGNKVIFLSLDARSIRRKRKYGFSYFVHEGVSVFSESFPLGKTPIFCLRFVYFLLFRTLYKKAIAQYGKPDLIHAHFGRTMGFVAWKAKQKYGINYAITEHDSGLLTDELSRKEKRILHNIYKTAKYRIAVSIPFCSKLSKDYSLPFSYVPNIIDTSAFAFPRSSARPHSPFIFVTTGQLIKRKGMDTLLNAFSAIFKRNHNIFLNVIGSGVEEKNLKQQSYDLGISEHVHFFGQLNRKEISNVFKNSDAFVLASKGETFGVVFIEAMCSGLPVIGTVCGGPESFVTNDVGYLAQINNVNSISEKMEELISNYSFFDGSKISSYAHSSFSPDNISRLLMEVFSK